MIGLPWEVGGRSGGKSVDLVRGMKGGAECRGGEGLLFVGTGVEVFLSFGDPMLPRDINEEQTAISRLEDRAQLDLASPSAELMEEASFIASRNNI